MLRRTLAAARYLLGCRAVRRGKWHLAVAHLSEAIRVLGPYAPALSNRGHAYQGSGDHRRAILDFDHAIDLDPTLCVAYHGRGISAKALGDCDRAVADQTKAIALNPTHSDAHAEQGAAYIGKHEYDLAIAAITKALKLDPDRPDHLKLRGYARFCRGDFAASVADLRQSLGREADPYAMLFCYLARARIGEAAEADLQADARRLKSKVWPREAVDLHLGAHTPETLLAALTAPDERAEAHFYVGQWHLMKGDQTEAVKALRKATQECPTVFIEHSGAVAELRRLGCL